MAEPSVEAPIFTPVDTFGHLISELLKEWGRHAQLVVPLQGTLEFGAYALRHEVDTQFDVSFDYRATISKTDAEGSTFRIFYRNAEGKIIEETTFWQNDTHTLVPPEEPNISMHTEDAACNIIRQFVEQSPIIYF